MPSEFATTSIKQDSNNLPAYRVRASAYLHLDQPEKALADLDRAVELNPEGADLLELRGTARFMLGRFKDAITDFDREIKLKPEREPWHWKRGLAYYYAGEYEKGRRQFERYHDRDDNDVENGVWRLLCMAKMKEFGLAGARKEMLKVRQDSRVGMMEAYAMFAGEKTPDDVLAAFEAGKPNEEELNHRRFYAHLYVGLYSRSDRPAGRCTQAFDHGRQASDHALHARHRTIAPGVSWRRKRSASRDTLTHVQSSESATSKPQESRK